jgi:hypothetical protein
MSASGMYAIGNVAVSAVSQARISALKYTLPYACPIIIPPTSNACPDRHTSTAHCK